MTATYFYIPLYWKCFFTSTVAAIIARLLFSWYHLILSLILSPITRSYHLILSSDPIT